MRDARCTLIHIDLFVMLLRFIHRGYQPSGVSRQALTTLNSSLLGDVTEHYRAPAKKTYPNTETNPLLGQLNRLLEASGMSDPFSKVGSLLEPSKNTGGTADHVIPSCFDHLP
jgi:hypothetical protein